MELHVILLLVAAGLALGFINNLAGAAGVIGLIAFESLLGLPTMQANASLRLSAVAIGTAGMLGFLSKGHRIPGRIWGYSLLTVPGAVAGAMMVRPDFKLEFRVLVIALLAVVLVQQLRSGKRDTGTPDTPKAAPWWLVVGLFTWLGAHMGFVQIATGLVAIFCLSTVYSRDLVQVNTAKMAFVLMSASASSVTLAWEDKILWGPALTMAAGAGLGSFAASRWSVSKGHNAVRVVVTLICLAVLIRMVYQLVAS